MKENSLQWFFNQLEFDESVSMDNIEDIFEQAKEMHKEEVVNAWENGYTHGASANDEPSIYHGTQYYKNTHEKE